MNIHKTNDDRRLAKLTTYAETYDNINSAIDEADQAITDAPGRAEPIRCLRRGPRRGRSKRQ